VTGSPERYRVDIPQADVDDLARRLRATRFDDDFANDDWSFGVPAGYAPAEEPDLYVADVRALFRPLR
jgi:hypothetical protein